MSEFFIFGVVLVFLAIVCGLMAYRYRSDKNSGGWDLFSTLTILFSEGGVIVLICALLGKDCFK